MDIKYLKNQNGQALLFVVVAMTMALAVGVSVSVNTLSSTSRTSNTDTASRALAAAEGGAEEFIIKPSATLATLSGTCTGVGYGVNNSTVPAACTVKFDTNKLAGDSINAQAVLTVAPYNTNKANGYEMVIKKDNVGELDVSSYAGSTLDFCWSAVDSTKPTDLYFLIYTKTGTIDKKYGYSAASRPAAPYSTTGFTTASAGNGTYSDCGTLSGYSTANIKRLRVYSLKGNSKVFFGSSVTAGSVQGYKITSIGQLINNGQITASKTVVVYRSKPFLPAAFDAGIYTLDDLN